MEHTRVGKLLFNFIMLLHQGEKSAATRDAAIWWLVGSH